MPITGVELEFTPSLICRASREIDGQLQSLHGGLNETAHQSIENDVQHSRSVTGINSKHRRQDVLEHISIT